MKMKLLCDTMSKNEPISLVLYIFNKFRFFFSPKILEIISTLNPTETEELQYDASFCPTDRNRNIYVFFILFFQHCVYFFFTCVWKG